MIPLMPLGNVIMSLFFFFFFRWLHEIDQNCDVVNRVLVGNKNDNPEQKVVLTEDARAFAAQMGIQVLKVSAYGDISLLKIRNAFF